MKILKKILSFFIILLLIQTSYSYWEYIPWKLYIAKKRLEKIKNGKKYENLINNFVDNASRKKLELLKNKIEITERKLKNDNSLKSQKLKIILNYLKLYINYKLNRLTAEKNKISTENVEVIKKEDKDFIKKEILKLQYSLWNNISGFIKNISKDFNKLTKYEERWNAKINLDIDYNEIWKVNGEFYSKNYTYKNNLIDTELNAELGLKINSKLKNDIEKKLNLNWKIDYIEKDGIAYLLIEKLNISDKKWIKEFEYYLEKLKDIAKQNKYIKIENPENKQIVNIIKNINLNKINNDINELTNTPLLEVYKKEKNKYYLKPTKYACNKFKELANKFDPINWTTCSTSQYNDLVKKLEKNWKLYLIINQTNKELVYKFQKTATIDSWKISINFDEQKINSIDIEIIPNQKKYKNEWLVFKYIYKKEIKFYFNAEKGKLNTKLNIELNNLNKLKNLQLISKNDFNSSNLNINLIAQKNKINWNLSFIDKKYSWNEKKYINSNIFNLNINWLNNNLTIWAYFKDLEKNKTLFEANIKKVNSSISGSSYLNDKNWNNIFKANCKWKITDKLFELNNQIILDKNFTATLFNRKSQTRDSIRIRDLKSLQAGIEQYYADFWEYPESIKGNKEVEQYFYRTPKDPLGAVEINNCKFGYYYEVWEGKNWIKNQVYKLSTCLENTKRTNNKKFEVFSWKIQKINKAFYINGYKTWKKSIKEEKEKDLKLNINIKSYIYNNNYELLFIINAILNNKEILNFSMEGKAKRTYLQNIEINKPTDFIELKDLK